MFTRRENLILGSECMASIARARGANVTPEEFDAAMRGVASGMVPWMACRATLREISEGLRSPDDPRVAEVPDLDAARSIAHRRLAMRRVPEMVIELRDTLLGR